MSQKSSDKLIVGIRNDIPYLEELFKVELRSFGFNVFSGPEVVKNHKNILNDAEGRTDQQLAEYGFEKFSAGVLSGRYALIGLKESHVEPFRRMAGPVIATVDLNQPLQPSYNGIAFGIPEKSNGDSSHETVPNLPRMLIIDALSNQQDMIKQFDDSLRAITS